VIAAIKNRAQAHLENPYLITIAVSLATFMEILDTTITNVSLTHIAGSLGAAGEESTWVLTSYLVANAIVLPISGWLANVIGRKRFFMICIAAFTAASFACGAATSLPMLVFFRFVQGLAGGGLQPVQQAIVMDSFPPEKRGVAFALTGITVIVAPVIGPTLGGYITDSYSWRWIFYMNIPVGIFALTMVGMLVRDPDHAKAKGLKNIDYTGLGLVALGLGALQIMLDKGQQDDWFASPLIVTCFLISMTALICAVIWLWNQKDPVIEIKLLKNPAFGLSCLSIFCVGAALYSSSALLPMVTQGYFGYDAFLAGLVLSPAALILLVMMPISGRLVTKFQPSHMIAFGFAASAIGMWATSHITPQVDYATFVMFRTLQIVGLPFLFVPVSTMAFADIPKEMSNKASALYSLSRNIGGSIGIALTTSYISRQMQLHQSGLSENFSASSPVYQKMLFDQTAFFKEQGYTAAQSSQMAFSHIYQELLTQSAILSYGDAFLILSYVMMTLSVVALLFMPRRKKTANAGADAEMAPAH